MSPRESSEITPSGITTLPERAGPPRPRDIAFPEAARQSSQAPSGIVTATDADGDKANISFADASAENAGAGCEAAFDLEGADFAPGPHGCGCGHDPTPRRVSIDIVADAGAMRSSRISSIRFAHPNRAAMGCGKISQDW
jgi:hypothetical protein